MERVNERLEDTVIDLGAVRTETHGTPNALKPDGIGTFDGAGLSDD